MLTGKYAGGAPPPDSRAADPERNMFMAPYLEPAELEAVEGLRPLAAELGISMAQLALAWCLRQPGVASVIVGATKVSQIEDNAAASGVELPPHVLERIDELFPGK